MSTPFDDILRNGLSITKGLPPISLGNNSLNIKTANSTPTISDPNKPFANPSSLIYNIPGQILRTATNFAAGDIPNALVSPEKRQFGTVPVPKILTYIPGYGKENVQPLAGTAAEYIQKLNERGISDKYAVPLGILGTTIPAAIDFTPFGGGKAKIATQFAEQIPESFLRFVAKTSDKKVLAETFSSIGVKDASLITKLTDSLSPVTKTSEVKKIFMDTVNSHVAPTAPRTLAAIPKADQNMLTAYVADISKGKGATPATTKIVQDILIRNGLSAPTEPIKLANQIKLLQGGVELAQEKAFNASMDNAIPDFTQKTIASMSKQTAPTISTSNRIIEPIIPQKGIIEQVADFIKNTPNKQGGFARIPEFNKPGVVKGNPAETLKNVEKRVGVNRAEYDPGHFNKKPTQLPPELEQRKIALEIQKETLANSPLNSLTKYVAKRGEFKGRLPEVTGKGGGTFSRKGDQLALESTGQNITAEELRAQHEAFLAQKEAVKQAEVKLKEDIKAVTKPVSPVSTPAPIRYSSEGIPLAPTARQQKVINASKMEGGTGEIRSLENMAQQALDNSKLPPTIKNNYTLKATIDKLPTPVKSKVNALDYLRTPEKVMEKLGLSKEMTSIRNGYEAYIKELPTNLQKVTDWASQFKNPKESGKRIFQYLDGKAIDLTPQELKVTNEIKAWLSEWADRLGLPQDKRIADYITHIFDDQLIKKEFDEDLAKIIAEKVPGSVYNPFLQSRLGAKGYKEDVWAALDAYVKRGTRKVNMDPALEKLQASAGHLEESQWNYVKRYADRLNMRPTEIDNLIDNGIKTLFGYRAGVRPVANLSKTLRRWTYRGMLGLNPGSALRNLSQGANTYAKLGEKYTALGYLKLFSKDAQKEITESGILNASFVQDRSISAIKKTMQKTDSVLFFMFEQAERINRGAAYLGAKAKGISSGMTEEKAIEYAKKIVRETQFQFGSIDTPVAMSSDIVKTLTQFQTFTTKQIEFLAAMAKNKEYAGLIRYTLAGLTFVYTIGQAFGMKPQDLIPAYRIGTPPSLKLPASIAGAVIGTNDAYGQPRSVTDKLKDIASTLPGYFPAGSQIKKTYQGYEAIQQGGSYDAAGRLQFVQGQSGLEKAQALLFGKYASNEARDYFNRGEISKEEKAKVQPTFDKVQELAKTDETAALDLYNTLSESDKAVYKKIQTAEKAKKTQAEKAAILPVFNEVQKLNKEGKKDEAVATYNKLDDTQKKAYKLVLDDMKRVKTASNGDKPTFDPNTTTSSNSVLDTVVAYAKALTLDPVTAFDRIFTGQKIRYVANGTIVVERLPLAASQVEKKAQGDDSANVKLDHTIPLQLGGSNNKSNLKLVPTAIWASYTPVENAIGVALRAGKINKSKAQSLISDFKNGKITAQDVTNSLQ